MTSQSNPGFRIEQNRKGISKKNKRIRISRQDCIQKEKLRKETSHQVIAMRYKSKIKHREV